MILTETIPAQFFDKRLSQIHHDIEDLSAIATQIKTKRQKVTQLFNQASSALNVVSQLTALVPQTSGEIKAILEAIFQPEKSEKPLNSDDDGQTVSQRLMQVASQLVPTLNQGQPITNTTVSRLMAETFGGSDAEGNWLWKDAYEALEIAQILLIQQQGRELLDQSNRLAVLGEIERIHRLCPTQTKLSEISLQLQQFSTPLPLGYIAKVAANITPDDLVLEPSAGTGILAAFAQIGGAGLILNEICPKRRGILCELFPGVPLSAHDAEQIDDYLHQKHRPTVVVMNPPFSASPRMAKRNQFATLKHLSSALARLSQGGRLVAITANWFSPLSHEWRDSFVKLQNTAKVVFSCGITGSGYAKHGTTIETRLTVFDKIAAENPGEFANCFDAALSLSDLLNYVEMFVPERQALTDLKEAGGRRQGAGGKSTTFMLGSANFGIGTVSTAAAAEPAQIILAQPKARQPQAKSEQKQESQTTDTFEDAVELEYTTCDGNGSNREMSDALYEAYEPQTIIIEGAVEHPSPLVQSAAMASVAPPKPTYRPHLPQRLISQGILSAAQLESAIYAVFYKSSLYMFSYKHFSFLVFK
jgi:predicted RNA methylase